MKKYFCVSRSLIAPVVSNSEEYYICQSKLRFVFGFYIKQANLFLFIKQYLSIFLSNDSQYDYLFKTNYIRRKMRFPAFKNIEFIHGFFLRAKRAERYFYDLYFRSELQTSNCSTVLIWNGSPSPSSILKEIALSLNLECFFWELGYFPGTVQIDPNGVNYENSLPRNPDFYFKNKAKLNQYERPEIIGIRESKKKLEGEIELPNQYIFVPFQVPSDSQILDYSNWIKDMEHLYQVIFELACAFDHLNFVIKEHPSYKISIIEKVKKHKRILFANSNKTPDLLAHCDYVITVNSTVGIEALVYNKPVITLGSACYNIQGLVENCSNMDQLNFAVSNFDVNNFDNELRDVFLKYLKHVFLVPLSIKSGHFNEIDITNVGRRLKDSDANSEFIYD
ncbi:hypothetical protein [Marinicellulosiphila megalodicopiae]|uniref:capsular polysaccharide export protein, LipB/KpsS family n=1 Tax=Marinicellulosiphila megalodicopiae TaxID=2724896 RepID=UPI003BB20EAC